MIEKEPKEDEEQEIEDIFRVYEMLKKDAKLLIGTLKDGVRIWLIGALMMIAVAIAAFFLGVLAGDPGMFLISVAGILAALATYWEYKKLQRKYSRLFEIVSRLN
jgi:hypothetical protein